MSDDLIELLLESELNMDHGAWATCKEAAVEILRLRAENEKLRAALAEIGYDFSTNRDEAAIVARKVLR